MQICTLAEINFKFLFFNVQNGFQLFNPNPSGINLIRSCQDGVGGGAGEDDLTE